MVYHYNNTPLIMSLDQTYQSLPSDSSTFGFSTYWSILVSLLGTSVFLVTSPRSPPQSGSLSRFWSHRLTVPFTLPYSTLSVLGIVTFHKATIWFNINPLVTSKNSGPPSVKQNINILHGDRRHTFLHLYSFRQSSDTVIRSVLYYHQTRSLIMTSTPPFLL